MRERRERIMFVCGELETSWEKRTEMSRKQPKIRKLKEKEALKTIIWR